MLIIIVKYKNKPSLLTLQCSNCQILTSNNQSHYEIASKSPIISIHNLFVKSFKVIIKEISDEDSSQKLANA